MTRPETTLEKEEEVAENIFSKTLKILAYPVSALAGYMFAKPVIRNAAYDNLKHTGAFKDIQPQHYERLNAITARFMKGERIDLVGETVKLHEGYKARLTERFEEMGLGTLEKQWKFIHATQQQNALLTGFTAAGISIGALLTMANNKVFANAISEHLDPGDDKEPERTP